MFTIREYEGDIFKSSAQTLVVPVNAIGAMGSGLALAFRNRVPGLYDAYRHHCKSGAFGPDKLFRYRWPGTDKQVICLPTKDKWWNDSDLEMVRSNLGKLLLNSARLEITSLALPALGCGLGQLSYEDQVRPMIMELCELCDYPVEIVLYKK